MYIFGTRSLPNSFYKVLGSGKILNTHNTLSVKQCQSQPVQRHMFNDVSCSAIYNSEDLGTWLPTHRDLVNYTQRNIMQELKLITKVDQYC